MIRGDKKVTVSAFLRDLMVQETIRDDMSKNGICQIGSELL